MGIWGWWAFDIFTLISTYLSVDEVSAQTIMRTIGLLTFMVPVGFCQACSILIGKSIGEANVPAIRQYYTLCTQLSVVVAIAQNLVLFVFEAPIIAIYTDIPTVVLQIEKIWFIFNLFVIFDTTQGVAMSVIRATG